MKNRKQLLLVVCALGLLAQSCGEDSNFESGQDSDCKTPGFVKCNGICIDPAITPEYCGANIYCEGYEACNSEQSCQNGKCITACNGPECQTTAVCTDNSTQCTPTGIPQICLSGTWHDKTPCDKGMTCQDGNCITACSGPECQTTAVCTDNSTQCSPTGIPQICLSGTWHDKTPCDKGMTCQDGVCSEESEKPQSCPQQGYVKCSGNCIDPMNSDEFCGADANCKDYDVCAKSETCQSGKCTPTACPDDQHVYQGTCEPDSVMHCGEHDFHCANEIDGWLNGECSEGKCSSTECTDNYHLFNHTCEKDTIENCGEHNLDCHINMPGFFNGQCIDHNCAATECIQGYHPYMNICEPDDENHCGKHTTKCSDIQGYATGECVDGECRVQSCTEGYHLDSANNRCIVDTNDCCGSSCSNCTSPNVCSNGACVAQCEAPFSKCNNECHNYANDINHCGGCNNSCTTDSVSDSTNVTCTNSTCKATSCRSGYHVYDGKCEKDTVENCGSHGTICKITNAINTICSDGICQATDCRTNYHVYNNACEADNTTNCGAHDTKCNISNATNTICSNGTCQATACKTDYHVYNNACEADTPTNCGSHGTKCNNVDNAMRTCSGGECSFICNTNYHEYNNTCEADSTTNCGTHGTQCNVENAKNTCTSGKCTFICNNDYHETNNECISNYISCNGKQIDISKDSENCGQCGNKCPRGKICKSSVCTAGTGVTYCNGISVNLNSDSANCEVCGYTCGERQLCKSSICTTGAGATYCNGKSVNTANDSANCGQCGNTCLMHKICSSGVCTTGDGPTYCEGKSINTANDSANCGMCGYKCAVGKICQEGTCKDGTGPTYCDGKSIDISNNSENCGQCGKTCPGTCTEGTCLYKCHETLWGWDIDLDIDLNIDSAHCGECGNVCDVGKLCQRGVCYRTEYSITCNGLQLSLDNSDNCGQCGNKCAVGKICKNGVCSPGTGVTFCNGGKVDLSNNFFNCGQCGKVCDACQICQNGVCVQTHDKITFGHYEQDNDTTNGKEPIEWCVLDTNSSGHTLLISGKALDLKPVCLLYNESYNLKWEETAIRSWLNGYDASYNYEALDYTSDNFIDTAFTAEEKARIISSTVPNGVDNATTDKIFLLSRDEWRNYYSTLTTQKNLPVIPTPYVINKIRSCDFPYTTVYAYSIISFRDIIFYLMKISWWSRTVYSRIKSSFRIFYDGGEEFYQCDMPLGVRPVLWLN